MQPVDWLVMAITSTAFAQVAFKLYFKRRATGYIVLAVAFFLLVPYATFNALKGLSLATVYVATAASQLMVVALSLSFLGEKYRLRQYVGLVLVLAGVVIYNL